MAVDDFQTQMEAAKVNIKRGLWAARFQAITTLCGHIIDDTPVDSGALRGSWRTNEGSVSTETEPRLDESGKEPKAECTAVVGSSNLDSEIYFSNPLHYAEYIEFDGHSSVKAPEGMVRKNLARWPDIASEVNLSGNKVDFTSARGVS